MSRIPSEPENLPLREAVRRQAEAHALTLPQLKALRSLQHDDSAPVDLGRRRWLQGGAAAGVLVATASGLLRYRDQLADPLQALADEIAFNHLQPKPLDALGDTLDALRATFASLGFRLTDDPRLRQIDGQLRGGRFCSVASVPAALLRYELATGHTTVYQARFDARRHRGVPESTAPDFEVRYSRGVRVCLWQAQGLLFSMAFS